MMTRELTSKEKEAVKEILDNFDYKTMRKTMKKLKWYWWDSEEVPTKESIRIMAENLLTTAITSGKKGDLFLTGSGGLEVIKSNGHINLMFRVSSYEVEL